MGKLRDQGTIKESSEVCKLVCQAIDSTRGLPASAEAREAIGAQEALVLDGAVEVELVAAEAAEIGRLGVAFTRRRRESERAAEASERRLAPSHAHVPLFRRRCV